MNHEHRRESKDERGRRDSKNDENKHAGHDRRKSTDRRHSEDRRHPLDKRRHSRDDDERRGTHDRRNSQRERRFSEERDRRHSKNEEHRPSIPKEMLDLQDDAEKTHKDGPDNSHYHQRWMFLWPFGKKDQESKDNKEEGNKNNKEKDNKNNKDIKDTKEISDKRDPVPQDTQCKLFFENEGVQTIDDTLNAPSAMVIKKPKMMSDEIQTSFANFGMQAAASSLPNQRTFTRIKDIKESIAARTGTTVGTGTDSHLGFIPPTAFKVPLRDDEVQTMETSIKQSVHTIQTSFANFLDVPKPSMKDSMTSTNFPNSKVVIPTNMGRSIKPIHRATSPIPKEFIDEENQTEVVEPDESEYEESQPVSVASSIRPMQSKAKPQPRKLAKQAEPEPNMDNLCPICKKGRYITQTSLAGILAAISCFLCCGPLWCRPCCDITVCNYCGCTKGFYKHGKDGT